MRLLVFLPWAQCRPSFAAQCCCGWAGGCLWPNKRSSGWSSDSTPNYHPNPRSGVPGLKKGERLKKIKRRQPEWRWRMWLLYFYYIEKSLCSDEENIYIYKVSMPSIPFHRGCGADGINGAKEGLIWKWGRYLISHSSVLSTLWDTGSRWNGCKLLHSGICSSTCSLVHTCHYGRLTTENRKLWCIVWQTKG